MTKQGLKLDDSMLAYMLLASCALEEKEKQMVMSAIQDEKYVNMKATISKIFVGVSVSAKERLSIPNSSVQVKSEPLFVENE